MNWFIFITMVGTYADGTQDTYLYTQPTLPTLEACREYVSTNSDVIGLDMMIEFDGKKVEQVFCIEEKNLEQLLLQQKGIEA